VWGPATESLADALIEHFNIVGITDY